MKTIKVSDEAYHKLKELSETLATQERDCQASPRYWGIIQTEAYPTGDDWFDEYHYVDTNDNLRFLDTREFVDYLSAYNYIREEEVEGLLNMNLKDLFTHAERYLELEDHVCKIPMSLKDVVVPGTIFLTKEDAINHLKNNRHHYNETARTYALTAFRSNNFEFLLDLIENGMEF